MQEQDLHRLHKKRVLTSVFYLNKFVFDNVLLDYNDTSSEEDDEDGFIILNSLKTKLAPRQRELPRHKHFFETVVPRFLPNEFQMHFRVSPTAFEALCQQLIPLLQQDRDNTGRPLKNLHKQILATIWLLATPDSYRSIGNQFDMGKSSLSNAFVRVIKGLNVLSARVIKWPSLEKRQQIIEKFYAFAQLNNVIGAIDGTFIPIKAPQIDPETYITRKCFYAVTLQAIAEPSLQFTDAFVGYPGSVSDLRIFRNSPIYRLLQGNRDNYFEQNTFIIGDKAYPLQEWCIPPYIEHHRLTPVQKNFNNVHAKTRQVIERAFALLFGRFRRLKYLDMNKQELIPATVLAACVLHNICLNHEDLFIEQYIHEGEGYVQGNEYIEHEREDREAGRNVRDHLAEALYMQRHHRR